MWACRAARARRSRSSGGSLPSGFTLTPFFYQRATSIPHLPRSSVAHEGCTPLLTLAHQTFTPISKTGDSAGVPDSLHKTSQLSEQNRRCSLWILILFLYRIPWKPHLLQWLHRTFRKRLILLLPKLSFMKILHSQFIYSRSCLLASHGDRGVRYTQAETGRSITTSKTTAKTTSSNEKPSSPPERSLPHDSLTTCPLICLSFLISFTFCATHEVVQRLVNQLPL